MSTTNQHPHELDEIQARDDPSKIYRRYVFDAPDVCSSCHRRIRHNGRLTIWGSKGNDKEAKDDIPEYAQYDDREAYGERAVYPMRTVCEDCGSLNGRADDQTLSKAEAIRRCEPLADRLEEIDEPVDVEELKGAVGQLKSYPSLEAFDTEIFERATKVAVTRERKRSR